FSPIMRWTRWPLAWQRFTQNYEDPSGRGDPVPAPQGPPRDLPGDEPPQRSLDLPEGHDRRGLDLSRDRAERGGGGGRPEGRARGRPDRPLPLREVVAPPDRRGPPDARGQGGEGVARGGLPQAPLVRARGRPRRPSLRGPAPAAR